jgi:DNA mismatch repair ATPase MutS
MIASNWLACRCRFYELFELDAFVGVDCLGLQLMKGDQPHAGFPEAAYYTMAEQLVRAGHRVVVIEQVRPLPRQFSSPPQQSLVCQHCLSRMRTN